MDTWTFGWTLAFIGMGGTMLVLWLMSLLILLIKKIFPYQPADSAAKKG
jgi:Na+-transporting methylmalonyl-CoA/oxaloacetate decarboxylase gamma subunit